MSVIFLTNGAEVESLLFEEPSDKNASVDSAALFVMTKDFWSSFEDKPNDRKSRKKTQVSIEVEITFLDAFNYFAATL